MLAPRCLAPVPSLPLVGAGDGDGNDAYAYLVAQRAEADALLRERERLSHELAEREAAGRRAEAARRVAAARRDAAAAGRAKAANAEAIKGAAHPKHREPTWDAVAEDVAEHRVPSAEQLARARLGGNSDEDQEWPAEQDAIRIVHEVAATPASSQPRHAPSQQHQSSSQGRSSQQLRPRTADPSREAHALSRAAAARAARRTTERRRRELGSLPSELTDVIRAQAPGEYAILEAERDKVGLAAPLPAERLRAVPRLALVEIARRKDEAAQEAADAKRRREAAAALADKAAQTRKKSAARRREKKREKETAAEAAFESSVADLKKASATPPPVVAPTRASAASRTPLGVPAALAVPAKVKAKREGGSAATGSPAVPGLLRAKKAITQQPPVPKERPGTPVAQRKRVNPAPGTPTPGMRPATAPMLPRAVAEAMSAGGLSREEAEHIAKLAVSKEKPWRARMRKPTEKQSAADNAPPTAAGAAEDDAVKRASVRAYMERKRREVRRREEEAKRAAAEEKQRKLDVVRLTTERERAAAAEFKARRGAMETVRAEIGNAPSVAARAVATKPAWKDVGDEPDEGDGGAVGTSLVPPRSARVQRAGTRPATAPATRRSKPAKPGALAAAARRADASKRRHRAGAYGAELRARRQRAAEQREQQLVLGERAAAASVAEARHRRGLPAASPSRLAQMRALEAAVSATVASSSAFDAIAPLATAGAEINATTEAARRASDRIAALRDVAGRLSAKLSEIAASSADDRDETVSASDSEPATRRLTGAGGGVLGFLGADNTTDASGVSSDRSSGASGASPAVADPDEVELAAAAAAARYRAASSSPDSRAVVRLAGDDELASMEAEFAHTYKAAFAQASALVADSDAESDAESVAESVADDSGDDSVPTCEYVDEAQIPDSPGSVAREKRRAQAEAIERSLRNDELAEALAATERARGPARVTPVMMDLGAPDLMESLNGASGASSLRQSVHSFGGLSDGGSAGADATASYGAAGESAPSLAASLSGLTSALAHALDELALQELPIKQRGDYYSPVNVYARKAFGARNSAVQAPLTESTSEAKEHSSIHEAIAAEAARQRETAAAEAETRTARERAALDAALEAAHTAAAAAQDAQRKAEAAAGRAREGSSAAVQAAAASLNMQQDLAARAAAPEQGTSGDPPVLASVAEEAPTARRAVPPEMSAAAAARAAASEASSRGDRLSPAELGMRLTAEISHFEEVSDAADELAVLEAQRGVSAAQGEAAGLARALQAQRRLAEEAAEASSATTEREQKALAAAEAAATKAATAVREAAGAQMRGMADAFVGAISKQSEAAAAVAATAAAAAAERAAEAVTSAAKAAAAAAQAAPAPQITVVAPVVPPTVPMAAGAAIATTAVPDLQLQRTPPRPPRSPGPRATFSPEPAASAGGHAQAAAQAASTGMLSARSDTGTNYSEDFESQAGGMTARTFDSAGDAGNCDADSVDWPRIDSTAAAATIAAAATATAAPEVSSDDMADTTVASEVADDVTFATASGSDGGSVRTDDAASAPGDRGSSSPATLAPEEVPSPPPSSDTSLLSVHPLDRAEARLEAEDKALAVKEAELEAAARAKIASIWESRGLGEAAAAAPGRAPSRRERVVLTQLAADKADIDRKRAAARAEVARQRLYFEQARAARGSPPRELFRARGAEPPLAAAQQQQQPAATTAASVGEMSEIAEDMSQFADAASGDTSPVQTDILESDAAEPSDGDAATSDASGSSGERARRRVGDLQSEVDAKRREATKLALAVQERALAAELEAVEAAIDAQRAVLAAPPVVARPAPIPANTVAPAAAEPLPEASVADEAPSEVYSESFDMASVSQHDASISMGGRGHASSAGRAPSVVTDIASILEESLPSDDASDPSDLSGVEDAAAAAVAAARARGRATAAAAVAAPAAAPLPPPSTAHTDMTSILEESLPTQDSSSDPSFGVDDAIAAAAAPSSPSPAASPALRVEVPVVEADAAPLVSPLSVSVATEGTSILEESLPSQDSGSGSGSGGAPSSGAGSTSGGVALDATAADATIDRSASQLSDSAPSQESDPSSGAGSTSGPGISAQAKPSEELASQSPALRVEVPVIEIGTEPSAASPMAPTEVSSILEESILSEPSGSGSDPSSFAASTNGADLSTEPAPEASNDAGGNPEPELEPEPQRPEEETAIAQAEVEETPLPEAEAQPAPPTAVADPTSPATPASPSAATEVSSILEESLISDTSEATEDVSALHVAEAPRSPLGATAASEIESAPAAAPDAEDLPFERPGTSRGRPAEPTAEAPPQAAAEVAAEDSDEELIDVSESDEEPADDSDGFEEYTTDDLELDEDVIDMATAGEMVAEAAETDVDSPVVAPYEPPPPSLRVDAAYAADFVADMLADSGLLAGGEAPEWAPEAPPVASQWLTDRTAAQEAEALAGDGGDEDGHAQKAWDRALFDATNEALLSLAGADSRPRTPSGVLLAGEPLLAAVQHRVQSWFACAAAASVDSVLAADALADERSWLMLDEEGHELKLEFADAIFEDLVMDAVGALDRAEAIRNRL